MSPGSVNHFHGLQVRFLEEIRFKITSCVSLLDPVYDVGWLYSSAYVSAHTQEENTNNEISNHRMGHFEHLAQSVFMNHRIL
jgi:hypothetical protein